MNAAATVLLAFLRPTFLRLFGPRDTLDTLAVSYTHLDVYKRQVYLCGASDGFAVPYHRYLHEYAEIQGYGE